MGKKRKHEQNGRTSMPRDQMPLEEFSDISPSSFGDVLIQFKDIIQDLDSTRVKVKTDDKLQKLGEKVKKIKNKSKKDLSVLKEALKKELIDEIKKALKKELIAEVREDLKKELIDEVKEELKLEIQQEMQKLEEKVESKSKEGVFKELKKELKEANEEQEPTRFQLEITSKVSNPVYKGKPIRTDDCEDHIEVVLYDGDKPIAPDHHLASATVQLVVLNEKFIECTPKSWSKVYFEDHIKKSRTEQVKNGRFKLVDGRYRHKGAVITDNSNRMDHKLGVMIVTETRKIRVMEGVSNSFKVQEAKTEINRLKNKEPATDDAAKDLPRRTEQIFPKMTKENGQGQQYSLPATGQMYNFSSMQNPPQRAYIQTAALQHAAQGQQHSVQPIGQVHNFLPMGIGLDGQLPVDHLQQQYTVQHGTSQLENHALQHTAQGQQHSVQPTGQVHNFLPMGNGLDGQLPVDHVLQQYTTQHGTTQLENHALQQAAQGQQHIVQSIGQVHNFLPMGIGLDGQLPVDHLQQQYTAQHGTRQLENHALQHAAQGQQHSVQPTGQVHNFVPMGNGLDGQLPVDHLQQQYTTQHGTTQLENHGM